MTSYFIKSRGLISLAGFTIAMAATLFSTDAFACRCGKADADKFAAAAEMVFRGKALKSSPVPGNATATTFLVKRQWKGTASETVIIKSVTESAACGTRFEPRETYLVFARKKDGALWTDSCWSYPKGPNLNLIERQVEAWKQKKSAN